MIRLVKEIKNASAYCLTLQFNTGEVLRVDLEAKLKEWSKSPESKFKQLLDPDYFCTAKLDKESETIFWDNGIDLCSDVLYSIGMGESGLYPTHLSLKKSFSNMEQILSSADG